MFKVPYRLICLSTTSGGWLIRAIREKCMVIQSSSHNSDLHLLTEVWSTESFLQALTYTLYVPPGTYLLLSLRFAPIDLISSISLPSRIATARFIGAYCRKPADAALARVFIRARSDDFGDVILLWILYL